MSYISILDLLPKMSQNRRESYKQNLPIRGRHAAGAAGESRPSTITPRQKFLLPNTVIPSVGFPP